jgi:hypothetical protein
MARQRSLPSPAVATVARATMGEQAVGRWASYRVRLALVLMIGLCQGVLYLSLLPPWQHYDEPTHFEYAWLIANHGGLPHAGDEDQAMRREVAASMLEHQFYWALSKPALLTDDRPIEIGITELLHPPAYYVLVSIPLRLVRHLDMTSQLYVARTVSLLLFLLTLAIAAGLLCDLTAEGSLLRWAVPLAMALLPTFTDVMTSVNNDVGSVTMFSLFLWGAVRVIRYGLSWQRLIWLVGTALLAAITKNTAAIALPLTLLVCPIALWVQRGWRWRWLVAITLGACAALLVACFGWGDAAYWYRGTDGAPQASTTRVENAAAPLGTHAIMIETPAGGGLRYLLNPVLPADIRQIAGRTVTVGGWVWADHPAVNVSIGLSRKTSDMAWATSFIHEVSITTRPTFVAWTFEIPERHNLIHYLIAANGPAEGPGPTRLFLDGALIVEGAYSTSVPPTFDDATAQSGVWAGRRFVNLLRNPSAERSWPRLRTWLDQALVKYIHRSPEQSIAAALDIQRIWPALGPYMAQPALDGLVQAFAWGHIRLPDPTWLYLVRAIGLLSLCGALRWAFERRVEQPRGLWPALTFLALAGLLVWANTIFRPLPLLGEQYIIPATRYTFPAIIVTTLAIVGGWWGLWARRFQEAAMIGLIAWFVALNLVSIQTIWSFYQSLPT